MSGDVLFAAGATIALVAVEAVLTPGHWPGVGAVAGLVGCVAIVWAAKAAGRAWLQRPEPPDG